MPLCFDIFVGNWRKSEEKVVGIVDFFQKKFVGIGIICYLCTTKY
jgi:hypothetical protein